MTATRRGRGHQTLMSSCLESRLNWAIGPFTSTYTRNSLPATIRETKTLPAFKKTVETVLGQLSRALDIALTVNLLVKHPRSGNNGAIQIVVFTILHLACQQNQSNVCFPLPV